MCGVVIWRVWGGVVNPCVVCTFVGTDCSSCPFGYPSTCCQFKTALWCFYMIGSSASHVRVPCWHTVYAGPQHCLLLLGWSMLVWPIMCSARATSI
jgi:hypothetical protein